MPKFKWFAIRGTISPVPKDKTIHIYERRLRILRERLRKLKDENARLKKEQLK